MKARWNREGEYWTMVRGKRVVLASLFQHPENGRIRILLHKPKKRLARYPFSGMVRDYRLVAAAKRVAEKLTGAEIKR